jgi:hypothetical protein
LAVDGKPVRMCTKGRAVRRLDAQPAAAPNP